MHLRGVKCYVPVRIADATFSKRLSTALSVKRGTPPRRACACVRACVYARVCMRLRARTGARVCMCVRACARMRVCACVRAHARVYV
jgi:hypothetical protein